MRNLSFRLANRSVLALASLWGATLFGQAASAGEQYKVIAQIPGADGAWDYVSVDSASQRLYVAHGGVAILDLAANRWLPTIAAGDQTSGVLPLDSIHRLIFTDRSRSALMVFDLQQQKLLSAVPIGEGPDGLAYDGQTGLAAAMTGGANGAVSVVDVQSLSMVATVPVGGHLEFPVSDNKGTVYINIESQNQIAVLNLATRQIERRIPLKGCKEPRGLAYDGESDLLIAGCDNVAKIVHGHDGAEVATLPIPPGADAVIYDASQRRAFLPCGDAGVLVVLDLSNTHEIKVVQRVKTQVGARTGAVDEASGKVYLPVAKLGPVIPPGYWPSTIAGTFKVLVVGKSAPPAR